MGINPEIYTEITEKLKALAHPYRFCIVKGLMEKKCNVTNMTECLDLPQPSISQHLSKLKAAGIVACRRDGVRIYYEVIDEDVIKMMSVLTEK